MPRLLIVDDDDALRTGLGRQFRKAGLEVEEAENVAGGIRCLELAAGSAQPFDAVLTDLQMPDGTGLDVLAATRRLLRDRPVLVLTGAATSSNCAEAMRLGALIVLEKPQPFASLEREVRGAIEASSHLAGCIAASDAAGLVGRAPALLAVLHSLVRAAPTDSTVLVTGETGTGKELVATAVHRLSRRAAAPLVVVNCAAIPETLLESELFGHVRGAFTGALQAREGKFAQARGGTLFLDEVGELPLPLQAKLLRVLQDRVVEPVGSSKPEAVDFRLVAATNRDLEQSVIAGQFRRDLFYRLNVLPLELPALRDRREDVPLLVEHFLGLRGAAGRLRFSSEAREAIGRYPWPGNVRELENLVERLVVMHGNGEVALSDLPPAFRVPPKTAPARPAPVDVSLPPEGLDLYSVMAEMEERLLAQALQVSGGNKQKAAQLLGINRTTLIEKLRRRRPPPES